jgi:hypothetical protein
MATTVGQHSVAAFTSPINGTTPIDANTVRSNDNTVRLAYVDHDADTGIHVQSSNLASRPIAGTAGRKWITEESGVYTLWFDDGVNWHPVSSEAVALTVLCTTALNRGDVVKVVGWNNGQDLPEVAKVASSSDIAFAVMTQNATINTMGYAINTGTLQDIDTAAFAVGNILYPNTTGGFTTTKPTSGVYQPVAFVLRSNASNGVVYVEFSAPRIVEASTNTASTVVLRDGSGNFSAGTITANLTGNVTGNITGTAPAGTLTGTTLASNVVSSSLTSVGTLSTLTVSGNMTVDTNTLFVDSTNNRVGIGTTSPNITLEVNSASGLLFRAIESTTGNNNRIQFGAESGFGFIDATASAGSPALVFRTASTERMRLDAAGQLGLGTTPNTWATGTEAVQIGRATALWNPDSASSSILLTNAYNDGAYKYINTAAASYYRQNGAAHEWHSAASGTAGNAIAFTQAMTLDASGNLGVGTASPTLYTGFTTLDIDNATNGGLLNIKKNGTTIGYLNGASGMLVLANANKLTLSATGANFIELVTNGSERARIDANGNFGLGVSPQAGWQSTQKVFEIVGASTAQIVAYVNGINIGSNYYVNSAGNSIYSFTGQSSARYTQTTTGIHHWSTAPSGTAGNTITFTQAMTLDASGNLGIGTATVGATGIDIVKDTNATVRTRTSTLDGSVGVLSSVSGYFVGTTSNHPVVMYSNNNERARIKAEGQFRFVPLASAPTTNVENGDVYYDSTTNKLRVRAAGAWVDLH